MKKIRQGKGIKTDRDKGALYINSSGKDSKKMTDEHRPKWRDSI